MNQKALLLLPILLLCGAATWLFAKGDDDVPLPADASPVAASPDTTDSAAQATTNQGTVDASAPADHGVTIRDAASTRSAFVPLPDDAKWIEVKIVDQTTGEPVPDATVGWFDNSVTEQLQKDMSVVGDDRMSIWRDQEELCARFGWQTKSDHRGIARVHQTTSTEVCARADSRYGQLRVAKDLVPPRDGYRLEIGPDLEVQVQVLDAAGLPAAQVPIAIAVHDNQGKFQYVWDWGPAAVTRAPDGIARLRHVQRFLRQADDQKVAQWRVRTFLPAFDDPGVECSMTAPPATPIVLRLPACGKVRVRIEFANQTIPPTTWISVTENQQRREFNGARSSLERPIDAEGWARFSHVPLGANLSASAYVFGGSLNKTFVGPVAMDGEVSVVLSPTDDQILLTGRLLTEQHVPLVDQPFRLLLAGQFESYGELRTDGAGRFVAIAGRSRKNNKTDSITAEVRRKDERPLVARAPGRELRAGTEDLGDLVVQLDALLVAGCYRLDGKPCKLRPGARVERFTTPDNGGTPNWRRQQTLLFHQDDEGNFEFRGSFPQGRYRLNFPASNHLPQEPVEFAIGQKDLVIELREGAPLAATMLLPKGSQEEVLATLVPTAGTAVPEKQQERLRANVWGREDGRWQAQWMSLTAGTYRLEIRLQAMTAPIHTVDDVQVPVPEGGDPRLIDIDLRTMLRLQAIRVFGPDGKPITRSEGAFFPLGQDPQKELVGFSWRGAETRLLMPLGPLDLMVAFSGYRPREVRCSGEPLDVRLDAWPTVTVQFVGLPPLPEGQRLVAGLRLENPPTRRYRSSWNSGELRELTAPPANNEVVTQGQVVLPIGEGVHTVELHLAGKNTREKVAIPAQQVLSTTGRVVIQVPPEELAKAQKTMEAAKSPRR